jgi:hypothetical protein
MMHQRIYMICSNFHKNNRPTKPAPQQRMLGRSWPDGWDSARFWELVLSFGRFPFRELFFSSRR